MFARVQVRNFIVYGYAHLYIASQVLPIARATTTKLNLHVVAALLMWLFDGISQIERQLLDAIIA